MRLFSPDAFRFAVLALLGVIALQAIPAGPLPTHLEKGSAFSASTSEVSLSSREESVERQIVVPTGDGMDEPRVVYSVAAVAGARPTHVWPGLRQRGPPIRSPRSPSVTPRGPPVLS